MADEAPAPGTPPAAPAAPPAPPVAPAPPPVASASGTPPAAPQRPPKRGPPNPPPIDQTPGWRKKVKQDVRRELRTRLGVETDEEVEEILAARAAGAPAAGSPPPAPAATAAADREKERLRKENKKLAKLAKIRKRKLLASKRTSRDEVVDLQLHNSALRAGVSDDHIEFAIHQYKQAAAAAAAVDIATIPDEGPFFAGLRAKHSYIFTGGAPLPTVPLSPTTAPPESLQPGGVLPTQAPTGTRPPALNVDDRDEKTGEYKMGDRDFRSHLARYGVRNLGG